MIGYVPLRATIENLYSILLNRTPRDEEITPYVESFESGVPLEQLSQSIATSQEAKFRRIAEALDTLTMPDADGMLRQRAVEISADDLMYTLADSYEMFTGREPSFSEIAKRFKAIVNGASLSREIAAISTSDEAAARQPAAQVLDDRTNFANYITTVYRRCLYRNISENEIDVWYSNYIAGMNHQDILLSIDGCEEAIDKRAGGILTEWEPGVFIQLLCEILLGHGASPADVAHYNRALEDGATSRHDLLTTFFVHAGRLASKSVETPSANNPAQAYIFGEAEMLTIAKWRERERELENEPLHVAPQYSRFAFAPSKEPLVSIITSLFKGGRFIETFLENITNQTIFERYCELLIIDANSPEGEFEKAEKFLSRFPNIRYHRCPSRIGIYDAWNLGVSEARGLYCTNANLDDCRRIDSLELQAATLDALPFVDIVYQDVFYSFDENMQFDEIQRFGFRTNLPIISRYNLLEYNSPHNAPMWRKRLHEDVGMFNSAYRSAGDAEFWIRCHLAGKTFYKINDPHVAYYNNPQGLSTRSDTPGAAESNRTSKTFNRRLISPDLTMTDSKFAEKVAQIAGGRVDGPTRYALVQAALRKISVASRPTVGTGH